MLAHTLRGAFRLTALPSRRVARHSTALTPSSSSCVARAPTEVCACGGMPSRSLVSLKESSKESGGWMDVERQGETELGSGGSKRAPTEPATPSSKGYTHQGTAFELKTIQSLSRFGFHLARTGRAGDRGVDFLGHWTLPLAAEGGSSASPLQFWIAGQCKSGKNTLGPKVVREFEGVLLSLQSRAELMWRGSSDLLDSASSESPSAQWPEQGPGVSSALSRTAPRIGILVAESGFSTGAYSAARMSHYPMALCQIRGGSVVQFHINSPLRQLVPMLSAVDKGLAAAESFDSDERGDESLRDDVVLLYNGTPLESLLAAGK